MTPRRFVLLVPAPAGHAQVGVLDVETRSRMRSPHSSLAWTPVPASTSSRSAMSSLTTSPAAPMASSRGVIRDRDRIAENCLRIQLGDHTLAEELCADLRQQVIRTPERRDDMDVCPSCSLRGSTGRA